MILSDIELGCADGKNEAEKEWFTDLFYTENHMVERVVNDHSVFVISGRKGTGKTILAKYIEKTHRKNDVLTKVVDKEELFLNYILEKTADPLTQAELSAFLRYCILLAVAKLIIENEEDVFKSARVPQGIISVVKCKHRLHKLKKFYYDAYPRGAFKTTSGEEEIVSESKLESSNKIASRSRKASRKNMLRRKQYFELLDELEALVLHVAKFTDFMIFFDDLDELESKKFLTEETGRVFTTLLDTVRSVNSKLSSAGAQNSKIVLLLRSDILDNLNARCSNSNKMIIDGCVNLDWIKSASCDESHPLMELILTKIKKRCYTGNSAKTNKEIYYELFSWVQRKSPIKFLIDNSFGRPRDVITYLNIVIEHYPNAQRFEQAMLTNPVCKKDYSKRFAAELKNELSIHCSEGEILSMLDLLKKFGKKYFSYVEIETFFNEHRIDYENIKNLKDAFEKMYRFGVVGNTWKTVSGQIKDSWGYREDGVQDPNFDKHFCVHYALRRELGVN